ncbi:hypothetical protein SDRG_05276 [Saprolegnia diclina VS20]|uniref:EF-hand domain-containing protein n=1 Tax=Saprolegnia diclina (strain VS20) TaxID=1156394 RepID=T0S306_SAPDV|nr:hypothetical protein SDRG_05276 [Saprolegnia diclina VS20]EQC37047.1 hypothetical protein SDRG_05276 [Saprolegnia diclina VS20]|eukprot:XP_008609209.1 hypothetical protein SDRG_05276 [Saprolegnia diclina VS20]
MQPVPSKAVVDFVQKASAPRAATAAPRSPNFYQVMVPQQPPSPHPVMDTSMLAKLAKVQLPCASKVNVYTSQLHSAQMPRIHCPSSPRPRPRTTPRQDGVKKIVAPDDPPSSKHATLRLDTSSREHLEIKACMLARMYHVDIHALEAKMAALRRDQDGRRASLALGQEAYRRKTQFLLDHYFCVDPATASSSNSVLYDVVDEWTLRHEASTTEIESFWDAVNAHMEESYVLKATALNENEPNRIAILVALDCLSKLADALPAHGRLLRVLQLVLERGLFVSGTSSDRHPMLYFERTREHEATIGHHAQSLQAHEVYQAAPPGHKISRIIADVRDDDEKHRLMLHVVSNHLPQSKLGLAYLRDVVRSCDGFDQVELLRAMAASRSSFEVQGFLRVLFAAQPRAFVTFLDEHDATLDDALNGSDCVQRLLERHSTAFADLFARAPSLLSSILRASPQHQVLEQVVDQHRTAIAMYLGRKQEALASVLMLALKDNVLALEEFFVKSPKALRDVLLNRPTLLPGVVKATPAILSDVLVNAKVTFGKVVTESPVHLTHVCTAHAPAVAAVLSTNDCLSAILAHCPQALSEYLEKSPETLVDIAHRQPRLLSTLFAAFPDLLVEPLEANPTLISSLLTTNRQLMQAIRFEDLDSAPVAFRKMASSAAQTDMAVPAATVATAKLKKRHNILSNIVKRRRLGAAMERPDVLREIAKLYVRKILCDQIDDNSGLDRVSLAELVQDFYIQELGLKSASQKRIGSLVAGVKKIEKDSSRAKWFGILLGATPELYNAQAIDVYLQALTLLMPTPEIETRLGDGSKPTYVPLYIAKDLAHAIFPPYTPVVFLADLEARIVALPSICERPAKKRTSKALVLDPHHVFLSFDDVLDCVMTVWYDYQAHVDESLTLLFAQADEDGNGVLAYQEFGAMIKKFDPTCDDRTIMRIFNMCGEENDQGEHEIKPGDFATVMRTYPTRPPPDIPT